MQEEHVIVTRAKNQLVAGQIPFSPGRSGTSSLPTKSEPRRLGFLFDSMLWWGESLVMRPAPLRGSVGRLFPAQELRYQERPVLDQQMQEPEALGDGLGSWMAVAAPAPSSGQAGQD